jgi:hypothetical protein
MLRMFFEKDVIEHFDDFQLKFREGHPRIAREGIYIGPLDRRRTKSARSFAAPDTPIPIPDEPRGNRKFWRRQFRFQFLAPLFCLRSVEQALQRLAKRDATIIRQR